MRHLQKQTQHAMLAQHDTCCLCAWLGGALVLLSSSHHTNMHSCIGQSGMSRLLCHRIPCQSHEMLLVFDLRHSLKAMLLLVAWGVSNCTCQQHVIDAWFWTPPIFFTAVGKTNLVVHTLGYIYCGISHLLLCWKSEIEIWAHKSGLLFTVTD